MKLAPLAVGGVVLYILLTKRSAESLKYYFKSFSLRFDGITPIFRIKLMLLNGSNQTFQIQSVVGNLSVGNQVIGNVYSFDPVKILANSQQEYSFDVRLNIFSIVSDLIDKINNGTGLSYQVNMNGTMNAEGFMIPVNFNFGI